MIKLYVVCHYDFGTIELDMAFDNKDDAEDYCESWNECDGFKYFIREVDCESFR